MSMRIIAGVGKGRKLHSPPSITRPTSDRAREGLFSSLLSTFSSLNGLNFLDLYAGSGAVGVEALSRGVALVDSVESDPGSAKVCEKNFALIASLEGVGRYEVHKKTVFEFLNHTASQSYEITYIDPPYEVENKEIEKILKKMLSLGIISRHGIVAIERDAKSEVFTWPAGLSEAKVRSYGAGAIHYGVLSEPK